MTNKHIAPHAHAQQSSNQITITDMTYVTRVLISLQYENYAMYKLTHYTNTEFCIINGRVTILYKIAELTCFIILQEN